ncbi:MAG: polysaccharide deacetylase family protein [Lachnospiraceae bacterium]|nr:polysaccharide deacetylase family protein [Lachnospiraceae bacterium]
MEEEERKENKRVPIRRDMRKWYSNRSRLKVILSVVVAAAVVVAAVGGISAYTGSRKNGSGTDASASGALSASADTDSSAAAESSSQSAVETTTQSGGRQIHRVEITDSLRALDNTAIGTGANLSDRDENNVPNGYKYYMSKYGSQYDAVWLGDTSEKTIYVTFDCGYDIGNAEKILDTLDARNIRGTFFITQAFFDEKPDILQRMITEGHTVGNHTISHPSAGEPSYSLEEQVEDVMPLEDEVYDTYGYEMRYFRYPEGQFSEQSLALMNAMGFECVFWSFAYHDWDTSAQPDPAEALQEMEDQLHPGAIYLLHAVSDTNTAVLGDFLDYARSQGYTFAAFGNDARY